MSAGWLSTVAASMLGLLEAGLADLALLDGDRLGPVAIVELDEEDLAGAGPGRARRPRATPE